MYTRKTVDVYIVFGNYGYGWDYITYCETLAKAKLDKKICQENEVGVFRIVKKRVSKEIYNNNQKFNDWLHAL